MSDMTVKEYIESLKKLDQEKNIWMIYDSFGVFEPTPDHVADAYEAKRYAKHGIKEGDYIIGVG